MTTHTYVTAGTYTATLTVTDTASCSTAQVFTGQTVSCNGSLKAEISHQVTVPAGVRLGVARTGSGSGTVISEPSGIECGGMCSYAFGEREKVKLTENPQPGSAFAGWSGACSGREATCEVMMSEAREVNARFNLSPALFPPNEAPPPSAPTQPVPPTLPPQTPRPSVQNARESATRWREGKELAHISRRQTPVGTAFSFSLNEQAAVSFSFSQLLRARPGVHKYPVRTISNGRGNCEDAVKRGRLSFTGHSGTNSVVFAGRISHTNKLKPGRYELTIIATDSAGQRSAPVSLRFTIVR
jgi:PKD repeat protein